MNPLLAQAHFWSGYTIVDWVKLLVVVAAVCALAWVFVTKVLGWTIPDWLKLMVFIVVGTVCALIAINIVTSL